MNFVGFLQRKSYQVATEPPQPKDDYLLVTTVAVAMALIWCAMSSMPTRRMKH